MKTKLDIAILLGNHHQRATKYTFLILFKLLFTQSKFTCVYKKLINFISFYTKEAMIMFYLIDKVVL